MSTHSRFGWESLEERFPEICSVLQKKLFSQGVLYDDRLCGKALPGVEGESLREAIEEASTSKERFDAYHARALGHVSAESYWEWSSPGDEDHMDVKRPCMRPRILILLFLLMTLILNRDLNGRMQSRGDFIVQDPEEYKCINKMVSTAETNPHIFTCITEGGTHCHRCEGLDGNNHWQAEVALQFFEQATKQYTASS